MRQTIIECDRCGKQNDLRMTQVSLANGWIHTCNNELVRRDFDLCIDCTSWMLVFLTSMSGPAEGKALVSAIRDHRKSVEASKATLVTEQKE